MSISPAPNPDIKAPKNASPDCSRKYRPKPTPSSTAPPNVQLPLLSMSLMIASSRFKA